MDRSRSGNKDWDTPMRHWTIPSTTGAYGVASELPSDAAAFKNLDQLAIAAQLLRSFNIPFDPLKGKVLGPPRQRLGKAKQKLKPDASSTSARKKVRREARETSTSASRNPDLTS